MPAVPATVKSTCEAARTAVASLDTKSGAVPQALAELSLVPPQDCLPKSRRTETNLKRDPLISELRVSVDRERMAAAAVSCGPGVEAAGVRREPKIES